MRRFIRKVIAAGRVTLNQLTTLGLDIMPRDAAMIAALVVAALSVIPAFMWLGGWGLLYIPVVIVIIMFLLNLHYELDQD